MTQFYWFGEAVFDAGEAGEARNKSKKSKQEIMWNYELRGTKITF